MVTGTTAAEGPAPGLPADAGELLLGIKPAVLAVDLLVCNDFMQ